jgi:hypothetical protein
MQMRWGRDGVKSARRIMRASSRNHQADMHAVRHAVGVDCPEKPFLERARACAPGSDARRLNL